MFVFGFLLGVAAATSFILYADGDLLIRLAERIRKVARRFQEWQRASGVPR